MILDTLNQWRTYAALSSRFAPAFAFLEKVTDSTPVGRHEIAGDDVYALVQRHGTRPVAERQFEAHRKYLDIQFMQSGRELIYWAPLAVATEVTKPYDDKGDAALYKIPAGSMSFQLRPRDFTILYPQDAHAPSCAWDAPAEVFKVVVKVRI